MQRFRASELPSFRASAIQRFRASAPFDKFVDSDLRYFLASSDYLTAMTDRDDQLERRIEELEAENRRLRQRLRERGDAPPEDGRPELDSPGAAGPDDASRPAWKQIEWWVEKIGIALLVLGMGLFAYLAVEQDWLSPAAAVGFGLLTGAGLGAGGWFVYDQRRDTGQLLMGAGSIALYLTLYAAYGEFELIPYAAAFGAMITIVVATFALSYLERLPALAVVGALGGFVTPILVSTDGNIPGLMTYTAILVAGMTTIYLVCHWKRLLAISAVGGWTFVVYATGKASDMEQWFALGGIVAVWFCVGVIPTLRAWLTASQRDNSQQSSHSFAAVLAVISGLLGYLLTLELWNSPGWLVITLGLALAAGCAAAAHQLDRRFSGGLVSAYRLMTPLYFAFALYEIAPDGHFSPFLAITALGAHYAAARYSDRALRHAAHLLTIPLILKVITLFATGDGVVPFGGAPDHPPFLHLEGLGIAVVVGCFFGAAYVIRNHLDGQPYRDFEGTIYRWTAHAMALMHLHVELDRLDGDGAFITVGWGLYAVVLLVAGLANKNDAWKHAGLVVVLATVGKLLLVDLQTLELIWRVLLFCGFGLVLLAVSQFTPANNGRDSG